MARRAPLPNLSLHDLARLARVADPDSVTSPGAVFLLSFYDLMLDLREDADLDHLGMSGVDLAFEAMPWRTADVFRVYTDLAAWRNEDAFRRRGLLEPVQRAEERIRTVLGLIGHRLALAIIDYYIEGLCPNHKIDEAPAALPDSGLCWDCEPWVAQYPPPAV